MPDGTEEITVELVADPDMLGGVWANFATVTHSPHEFTIDFIRIQYGTSPAVGVLVQRVNMSPLFVKQLIAALTSNLTLYASNIPDGMVIPEGDN